MNWLQPGVFFVRLLLALGLCGLAPPVTPPVGAELRVGAATVDISPEKFPVLVNGGMTSRSASKVVMPLHARAIVIDDGRERVAIVVADSCMITRQNLDDAKHLAALRTNIRPDRMLISATHTHTAPSAMGCLGTDEDLTYTPFLRERLAEAIALAESRLEPAEIGWTVANAADYTALRRWIIRPDRMIRDPFGNLTVRANMHAGANLDNVTGESGPEDPDLSMIAFRSTTGRPIALLANFSMHYFSGVEALHPDYFGIFCEEFQDWITTSSDVGSAESSSAPPFVAIMSHGCSGDIWRRDYTQPANAKMQSPTVHEYTNGLLEIARSAWESISYFAHGPVAMAERRLPMKYRVPDQQRLEWAKRIVAELGDQPPKTSEQVYAREQVLLDELQSTEVVVQALRIGNVAIATTPNETYALTGMKIKLQSPLEQTMVIELANGGDGYIPPPEQHFLGGYNTWPARSAGLEISAEPRITQAALELLEQVSDRPRRMYTQSAGPAASAIAALRPVAWWRMDEMAGPHAADASGNGRDALYEPGVVFFLEGPRSANFCNQGEVNRSAHFAGGRLRARLPNIDTEYSVSLWFWNGMPADGRETSGWLLSRDFDHGLSASGQHLGISGTAGVPGRLIVQQGTDTAAPMTVTGRTEIGRWTWYHVVLVRTPLRAQVFLNGTTVPEIDMPLEITNANGSHQTAAITQFFVGGRSDNLANWEGRLDEVAIFDRALPMNEIRQLAGHND